MLFWSNRKRTFFTFHIYISRGKVCDLTMGTSKSFLWPLNWLRLNPSKLQVVLKLLVKCKSYKSPHADCFTPQKITQALLMWDGFEMVSMY